MSRNYVLGLTCCFLLTSVVHAQNLSGTSVGQLTPSQPIHANTSSAMNLRNPMLNKGQMQRLNNVTQKIQGQYSAQHGKLNARPGGDARLQQLNQQYFTDFNKTAGQLLDQQQQSALLQFRQQYGGVNTLNDPNVQKRLNLTPAQVSTLQNNVNWNNLQMHNIQVLGATNPAKAGQRYDAYWQERQQRYDSFLTTGQKQLWREMTGYQNLFQDGNLNSLGGNAPPR